jgi:hypothetical protein
VELRLRGRKLPEQPLVMADLSWPVGGTGPADAPRLAGKGERPDRTADALGAVAAAVAAGAALVDLGQASAAAIASIQAVHPDVLICAGAPGADLTRDAGLARRTGAAVLQAGPGREARGGTTPGLDAGSPTRRAGSPAAAVPLGATVASATAGSAPAARGLVAAEPGDVAWLTAAGWAVLVDADSAELATTLAVASVCAWLGARIVRTRHVAAVRQAVDMVASIRGTRAPLATRRGLA